jgi:hypothetical protein
MGESRMLMLPLKKLHGGRGAGRDCIVIEGVGWLGPIPSLQNPLSPGHFFLAHEETQKDQEREASMPDRNPVGAACSAYLLLAYDTLAARKPARSPLSLPDRNFVLGKMG